MLRHLPYPVILFAATLVHSLWLGPLIAWAAGMVARRIAAPAAEARYRLYLIGLAAIVALPIFTVWIAHESMFSEAVVREARLRPPVATAGWWYPASLTPTAFWVVVAWAVGVAIGSMLLAVSLTRLARIVATSRPSPRGVSAAVEAGDGAGLIEVRESDRVSSPCVVGIGRSVILLPPGILERLAGPELAAVLRHEMAHVTRSDFATNLAQRLIETWFWFNPTVHRMSSAVRQAREECCDRAAVGRTGDGLVLARALILLEEGKAMAAAVGLWSGGRSLSSRIEALTEPRLPTRTRSIGPVAIAAGALAILLVAADRAGELTGAVLRRTMPIRTIPAADPAGAFDVAVLGGRLLSTSLERQGDRVVQRGRTAMVVDPHGAPLVSFRMEINGFQWAPRPAPPSSRTP